MVYKGMVRGTWTCIEMHRGTCRGALGYHLLPFGWLKMWDFKFERTENHHFTIATHAGARNAFILICYYLGLLSARPVIRSFVCSTFGFTAPFSFVEYCDWISVSISECLLIFDKRMLISFIYQHSIIRYIAISVNYY